MDVVVSPSYVEFGEQGSGVSFIYKLGNQWQWIGVSNRPLVKSSVVLDGSELSILLFDKKEGCGIWAFRWSNITFSGVLDDELL